MSNQLVLYPITNSDIKRVKEGQSYIAPVDGWWMSDFYLNEVMQVKVEESK